MATDLDRFTDEQIAKLVPLVPALAARIENLIERTEAGTRSAERELAPVIELYAERHPDLLVRYLARRVMAQEKVRLQ